MFLYISCGVSIVFLVLIYYYQITQTEKRKNVDGLSLSMNIIKNVCTILTLVSLYLTGSPTVSYIAQAMSLLFGTYTILQYLKYKKGSN